MVSKWVRQWRIFAIGSVLVLAGFVVPFLMCIQVMAPSFTLGFLAVAASVAGSLLGIIGIAEYGQIDSW